MKRYKVSVMINKTCIYTNNIKFIMLADNEKDAENQILEIIREYNKSKIASKSNIKSYLDEEITELKSKLDDSKKIDDTDKLSEIDITLTDMIAVEEVKRGDEKDGFNK